LGTYLNTTLLVWAGYHLVCVFVMLLLLFLYLMVVLVVCVLLFVGFVLGGGLLFCVFVYCFVGGFRLAFWLCLF